MNTLIILLFSLVRDKFKSFQGVVFIDQLLVSGSNFILGILLARNLGVELYGRFTLIWLIILFFSSLQLAFIISPMYSLGAKRNIESKSHFLNALKYIYLIFFSIVILMCSIFFKFGHLIWGDLNLNDVEGYILPCILVFLLHDFLRRYFIFTKRNKQLILIDIISYLGQILGVIIYVRVELISVFQVLFVVFGLSNLVGLFSIKIKPIKLTYLRLVFLDNWRFSKWLVYSSILQWGSGNYFILAAGALLGNWAVGAIKVIQNLMGVLNVLFLSFENILPIKFSEMYRNGSIKLMRTYFFKLSKIGVSVFSILLLLSILFNEQLVLSIYGNSYIEYSYMLIWFILINLFIYFGILLRYVLRTLEITKAIFYGYVINILFALSTSKILIENFNLEGVVFGLLITQIIMICVMLYFINKNVNKRVIRTI